MEAILKQAEVYLGNLVSKEVDVWSLMDTIRDTANYNNEWEDVAAMAHAVAAYQQKEEADAECTAEEPDAEACPGCGCMPGEGITAGCNHPDGCGYNPIVE